MSSWTKEQVEAYISGKSYEEVDSMTGSSQPDKEETSTTEVNVETPVAETTSAKTSNDEPVKEEISTSQNEDVSPEKTKSLDEGKRKVPTHQDKINHSFAKKNAIIKAQREELEALKARIKEYEGLKKEDFNNDEETFNSYKFDQMWDKRKAEEMEKNLERDERELQTERNMELAQQRLEACFPDESEQLKYKLMLGDAEQNWGLKHPEFGSKSFTEFLMKDPDNAIISYLRDSENGPKMIRHFIAKPEAAERIMNLSNPFNKFYELKQLENRMLQFERVQQAKNKPVLKKKELPETGNIVKNTNKLNNGFDFDKPWTMSDVMAWESANKNRG